MLEQPYLQFNLKTMGLIVIENSAARNYELQHLGLYILIVHTKFLRDISCLQCQKYYNVFV
jgi:hypothetical protein